MRHVFVNKNFQEFLNPFECVVCKGFGQKDLIIESNESLISVYLKSRQDEDDGMGVGDGEYLLVRGF